MGGSLITERREVLSEVNQKYPKTQHLKGTRIFHELEFFMVELASRSKKISGLPWVVGVDWGSFHIIWTWYAQAGEGESIPCYSDLIEI